MSPKKPTQSLPVYYLEQLAAGRSLEALQREARREGRPVTARQIAYIVRRHCLRRHLPAPDSCRVGSSANKAHRKGGNLRGRGRASQPPEPWPSRIVHKEVHGQLVPVRVYEPAPAPPETTRRAYPTRIRFQIQTHRS